MEVPGMARKGLCPRPDEGVRFPAAISAQQPLADLRLRALTCAISSGGSAHGISRRYHCRPWQLQRNICRALLELHKSCCEKGDCFCTVHNLVKRHIRYVIPVPSPARGLTCAQWTCLGREAAP